MIVIVRPLHSLTETALLSGLQGAGGWSGDGVAMVTVGRLRLNHRRRSRSPYSTERVSMPDRDVQWMLPLFSDVSGRPVCSVGQWQCPDRSSECKQQDVARDISDWYLTDSSPARRMREHQPSSPRYCDACMTLDLDADRPRQVQP
jgi:hypothetical protein